MGKRYIKIYCGDLRDVLVDNNFPSFLDECFKKDNYPVIIEHYRYDNGKKKIYSSDKSTSCEDEFDPTQDKLLILWNLYWQKSEEESRMAQINQIQNWINEGGKVHITGYCSCPDYFANNHLDELKSDFGKEHVASKFEDYIDDEEIMKQFAIRASLGIKNYFDKTLIFDENKPAKLEKKPN